MVEKEFQNLSLKFLTPFHLGFRVVVDQARIGELAETVKTHGMLEPLIVRPSPTEEGKYEVVCGLRRLRAAEEAGLENVPCIVAELSDEFNGAVLDPAKWQRDPAANGWRCWPRERHAMRPKIATAEPNGTPSGQCMEHGFTYAQSIIAAWSNYGS